MKGNEGNVHERIDRIARRVIGGTVGGTMVGVTPAKLVSRSCPDQKPRPEAIEEAPAAAAIVTLAPD